MQLSTLALGSFIVIFSLYTLYMSISSPEKLIRLKYMREKLGLMIGTSLHTLVYAIIPLIFAYFVLKAGIAGITISQFITGTP
jgi:hypothetical protein